MKTKEQLEQQQRAIQSRLNRLDENDEDDKAMKTALESELRQIQFALKMLDDEGN